MSDWKDGYRAGYREASSVVGEIVVATVIMSVTVTTAFWLILIFYKIW